MSMYDFLRPQIFLYMFSKIDPNEHVSTTIYLNFIQP